MLDELWSNLVNARKKPSDDSLSGQIEKGNIDLYNRPRVVNPDGSISTVRSLSFNPDGKSEVLIPTVVGDKIVSDEEAIQNYFKTGQHLGKFKTPQEATRYAETLHKQQESFYK